MDHCLFEIKEKDYRLINVRIGGQRALSSRVFMLTRMSFLDTSSKYLQLSSSVFEVQSSSVTLKKCLYDTIISNLPLLMLSQFSEL